MSGIFISYRRTDSAGYAGRLYDRLVERFGAAAVFMDVDAIHPGEDFARVLEQRMRSCDAVVVVIGDQWLTVQDEAGCRRLDEPGDYVRMEVAMALARGIPVLPVLVEDAPPPPRDALPAPLKKLASLQALSIGHDRFVAQSNDLIQTLERILSERGTGAAPSQRKRKHIAALLGSLALLAILIAAGWVWHGLRSAAPIDGLWSAQVADGARPAFRIELELQSSGDRLLGTVSYPTGVGGIKEGSVQGRRVSFTTAHLPQFEQQEALTRFEGTFEGDRLELVMQNDQAVRRFTATRQAR